MQPGLGIIVYIPDKLEPDELPGPGPGFLSSRNLLSKYLEGEK
jgi:hypothetical protein